jgi:hypothetical protein
MTQRGLYDRSVHDLLGHLKAADPASPDTIVRRSLLRTDIVSAAGITMPTTGKLLVVPVAMEGGDPINSIGWVTGTTAAVTPTAGFAAMFNPSGVLVASSADFVATARAASTVYTSAMAVPTFAKVPGVHYAVLCITAGTMPTLLGSPVAPAIATGESSYARESSATYTTAPPAALPALVSRLDCPYIEVF